MSMNQSQLGELSRTFELVARKWPGLTGRTRRTPPVPTGKPAFWFGREREPWKRISAEIDAEAARQKNDDAVLAVMEFAGAAVAAAIGG